MAENNNNVTENAQEVNMTPAGNTFEVSEKKSVFRKIGEAKDAFVEKHPKISAAVSTTIKVAAGVGLGVAATVIGSKVKKSECDGIEEIDVDSIESYDPDVIEALELDNVTDNN